MKKTTMTAIINLLSNQTAEMTAEEIIAELQAELDKTAGRKAEKAAERANVVAVVAPKIQAVMADGEFHEAMDVYKAVEDWEVEDWTARKVQYVLTHELADKVEVDASGKKNTYKWIG